MFALSAYEHDFFFSMFIFYHIFRIVWALNFAGNPGELETMMIGDRNERNYFSFFLSKNCKSFCRTESSSDGGSNIYA